MENVYGYKVTFSWLTLVTGLSSARIICHGPLLFFIPLTIRQTYILQRNEVLVSSLTDSSIKPKVILNKNSSSWSSPDKVFGSWEGFCCIFSSLKRKEMCIFVAGEYLSSFVKTSCCLEGLDELLQKWTKEMGCECEVSAELCWVVACLVLDQIIPGAEPLSCSFWMQISIWIQHQLCSAIPTLYFTLKT